MCWRSFKTRLLTVPTENNDNFWHFSVQLCCLERPFCQDASANLCKMLTDHLLRLAFFGQWSISPNLLPVSFWRAGAPNQNSPYQGTITGLQMLQIFCCLQMCVFFFIIIPVVGFVLTSFFSGCLFSSRLFEPADDAPRRQAGFYETFIGVFPLKRRMRLTFGTSLK